VKPPKDIFEFDDALQAQAEDYSVRNDVLGLEDVEAGIRVPYPTTIYNVKGDETSGVAGLLKPDGEFIRAQHPRTVARYWEFDETLKYERIEKPTGIQRARGNSWAAGAVIWDGSVAGSINQSGLAGDETDLLREVVKRREWDAALTPEWLTTGELQRAIESGRSMEGGTRRPGRVHMTRANWDDREYGQAA
jgi:hypothetical protein